MTAPLARKTTHVAVGVLMRSDGSVLLADRPLGKPYAGYWEFPGGKIEPGEPVTEALARELHEELGIEIESSTPWVTFDHDYPHAYVELQFRLVHRWRGQPHAREGQRLCFVNPAQDLPQPLLPAAVPAMRWLKLPRIAFVVPACTGAQLDALLHRADGLCPGRAGRIVIVDGDRRGGAAAAFNEVLSRRAAWPSILAFATGPGADRVTGADGVVLDQGSVGPAHPGIDGTWCGTWIKSLAQLPVANRYRWDFACVESMSASELDRCLAAEQMRMPLFLPSAALVGGFAGLEEIPAHGCWLDLR